MVTNVSDEHDAFIFRAVVCQVVRKVAGFIGKMATCSPKMSVTANQILQCFHSKDNIVHSGTAFNIGNGVK